MRVLQEKMGILERLQHPLSARRAPKLIFLFPFSREFQAGAPELELPRGRRFMWEQLVKKADERGGKKKKREIIIKWESWCSLLLFGGGTKAANPRDKTLSITWKTSAGRVLKSPDVSLGVLLFILI